jgi:hypothetical protein
MELLNASILKGAVSTKTSFGAKAAKQSIVVVVLPRTKVLIEGTCEVKHVQLYDE